MVQPPLVLMDEPLSNLDAALRLEMRSEIRRIHQEFGLTTIYVTHDQEEALSLADRLVVLRDGEVSQVGTPAELYEHPASPHVAAFMGYRNLLSLTATSPGTAGGRGLFVTGTPAGASTPAEGQPVIVAIRPEDLHVVADGGPAASGAVSRGCRTPFPSMLASTARWSSARPSPRWSSTTAGPCTCRPSPPRVTVSTCGPASRCTQATRCASRWPPNGR